MIITSGCILFLLFYTYIHSFPMPVDNFKSLQAYSVGLRQEAILVGGKVVHLKVGSFASNLHGAFDHAKAVLGSYTEKKNVREADDKGGVEGEGEAGFAQYAQKLEDHLTEALTMVSERPSDEFADAIYRIVHADPSSLNGEYWLNVSLLERVVEWLPQWILDTIIVSKFQ